MKSPVVYGNPLMFGPVDWNYAAGGPVRRGKSVEELGDAGWNRERERIAHLQHIQQLHQLQLQQQQVGYPAYGVIPPGHVMVPNPGHPVPGPGCPMPVHGDMMVHVGGPGPPPVHLSGPWPGQWENQAQIRQGNVCQQPGREYEDQEKRPQGHDVYFHPGSEDGHLNVRISEWKGGNCFYQGPEDYSRVPQKQASNDLRTQEGFDKLDDDRRRRDDWDREKDRYDNGNRRDLEECDRKEKYSHRDHYERRYDDRDERYSDGRNHRKPDPRDNYNSEYEDSCDHKDTYTRRDDYRVSEKDYYDSKESDRYREREHYQRREEDRRYDERKRVDRYSDRHAEDRCDRRESNYKERDDYNQRGKDAYADKGRGQYDSELDECGYRERYQDPGDDSKEEPRRRDHYERRPTGNYDRANEDRYGPREGDRYGPREGDRYSPREGDRSHCKAGDRYRDLRSASVECEEYPRKESKTHCEQWVEEQLRERHSFEDAVAFRHGDDRERGYESSAGSVGSKRGRKPVYVGSLDRNSFYRKTAPSSLRNSQFATSRKPKQGKYKDIVT
ncbi:hypothetical protein EYF80_022033 [Liparis tanakae]|uniref:Uncharacterized protein n=1 Tax=Liparis tanakae TaxID=230148 RepID=A0A4Z2HPL4_9TELE|nr:hypothetical protein EYF80_022033 [Liparis tanakae]